MNFRFFIILIIGVALSSCSLSKKKCPIPSCKISKMHQHALVFTNTGKTKKAKEKLKKELADSTSVGEEGTAAAVSDSLGTATSGKKEKKKKKKKGDDSALTEEELLLAQSGESIDTGEETGSKKKKKKKQQEEELDDDSEDSEETDESAAVEKTKSKKSKKSKKQQDDLSEEEQALMDEGEPSEEDDLKLSAKEIRKADKEAKAEEKRAQKEEKEKDPFNVAYRSRITPWWLKDQHPEVGKDWKPTKKVYEQPDQRKARKLFRNMFGYPTR